MNKQRERLVELIQEASAEAGKHFRETTKKVLAEKGRFNSREDIDRRTIYEVEADYLLAQGIIVPPCKVGDKVYWISHITKEIETDIVIAIHQYEDDLSIATNTLGTKCTTTYSLNRFLEIMHFTKEEAEAQLKGGVQG